MYITSFHHPRKGLGKLYCTFTVCDAFCVLVFYFILSYSLLPYPSLNFFSAPDPLK